MTLASEQQKYYYRKMISVKFCTI